MLDFNHARRRQQIRRFGHNSGRPGSRRRWNTHTPGRRGPRCVSKELEILFLFYCCANSPLCIMLTNLNCQSTFFSVAPRSVPVKLPRLPASPSALLRHSC
jgi:hypothetical protein